VDLERTQDTELDLVQPSGFTTVKREFLGRRVSGVGVAYEGPSALSRSMRELDRIEDGLSPEAAESLSGIVVFAQRVRRAVIGGAVVSAMVLCIAAAAHTL